MAETTKKNKVHYDLKNVHFAPITEAEDGTVSFGAPVREYGAISMDMAPVGDSGKLRADGIDYYTFNSNGGYEGDVNFAQVSELFRRAYLGEELTANDKVQVEKADANPTRFAMLFEFAGDVSGRRHVLYNGLASRPNIKGENKDNQREPDTESLPVKFSPLPDNKVKASTTAETPQTVYDNWFKTVWEKDSEVAPVAS